MKLVQNHCQPDAGGEGANFQISYQLARFVNPMAFQGTAAPSNPVAANDQDFVLQAADNDNPLKYMGPSLLDRTHQISFGGNSTYLWLPPRNHRTLLQPALKSDSRRRYWERRADLPDGLHGKRDSEQSAAGHKQRRFYAQFWGHRPERSHQQLQHHPGRSTDTGRTGVGEQWLVYRGAVAGDWCGCSDSVFGSD